MIRTEFFGETDGMTLIRTWSDAGMMIRQDETGDIYEDAVDPDFMNRTYTETDISIGQDVWEDPEEVGVPEETEEESKTPIDPSK